MIKSSFFKACLVFTYGQGMLYKLQLLLFYILGMRDYAERYSAGIVRVSETFGAPRAMTGPTLDTVADYLDNKMPLAKLPEVSKV